MNDSKDIKNRIESIEDTYKITNAMYMIASNKLKKAKSDLDKTKPYFNALRNEIKRLFRVSSTIKSSYFYPIDNVSDDSMIKHLALVITGDKGLAGAYNSNVIKKVLMLKEEHKNLEIYVVGEYGRHFLKEHNVPIVEDFRYTASSPTMNRAREIADRLLEAFNKLQFVKLFVIYTDLKNGLTGEANLVRLLPFHRQDIEDEKESNTNIEFYPSLEEILNNSARSYATGYIYSALVDSYCCEQEARMLAMSSANTNAENIIFELKQEYNKVRQAKITREITEIVSGVKARKEL